VPETDVIIAGAGPAGCTFALTLDSKISIVILEKRAKENLGHDWIDGFDLKSVKNFEFLKYVTKLQESPPANFYSPDRTAKISAPLSGRIDVDRLELAQTLVTAIEQQQNIQFIEQALVTDPLLEEGVLKGVYYLKDEQQHSLRAKLIVDATGFGAVLRNKLGITYQLETKIEPFDTFVTYRKYIKKPVSYRKKEHVIFFGKHNGISWINSEIPKLIDLFAGVPDFPEHIPPSKIIQELEAILIEEIGTDLDLTPVRGNYGGIIPTRRCLDNFCGDHFLIIGDAACQVEPINGSGIASGMLAGYFSGKLVNTLFQSGADFSLANLWHYNFEWIKHLGAQYASLDILRLFLLTCDESDYNFLIKRRIITDDELRKSMLGDKIRITLLELLRKLYHGISRLGLLFDLHTAIKDADKIRQIYAAYPSQYDPKAFKIWQETKNRIINKYYRKLRAKIKKLRRRQ